jgi:hypothetical protein
MHFATGELPKMSHKGYEKLDSLIDEILTDAYGDEEQRWAFLQALTDNVKTPCAATIAGQSIRVTRFDYGGNDRVGLTAKCRRTDGAKYSMAAADIVLEDAKHQRYIAAYRRWMGLDPYPRSKRR